ncbi:MAG: hypothetical protein Tsb009_37030 [Planctomycetaceae bacterium]
MVSTKNHPSLQQLVEHISDWNTGNVKIDESQRLVRNVALAGLKSKNGYRYSEQALRDAIQLYEGKPVFLDHAHNQSRPYERSTRDLVGSVINTRFEAGRVRSDIKVLDTESGRTFLALVTASNPAVGMSHVVLARRSPDQTVVESIHEVVSVDAVVFPATTTTFREQNSGESVESPIGSMESIIESIDQQLPEHVQNIIRSDSASVKRKGVFPHHVLVEVQEASNTVPTEYLLNWSCREGLIELGDDLCNKFQHEELRQEWANITQMETVHSENQKLKNKLRAFQEREQQAAIHQEIDSLIAESNLPEYAITELLRQQLAHAPTSDDRRALIAERLSMLNASQQKGPFSHERQLQESQATTDDRFVSIIRTRQMSVLSGVQ